VGERQAREPPLPPVDAVSAQQERAVSPGRPALARAVARARARGDEAIAQTGARARASWRDLIDLHGGTCASRCNELMEKARIGSARELI
jgi:hypothetical protein